MADQIVPPVEAPPADTQPTVVPPVDVPPVVLPSDTVEFTMPEKFSGKTAEEIAKSYMELEAFKAKEETPPKEPNEPPPKEDATPTQDLIDEYVTRGTELTEEDYKDLEEKGYSQKQVDTYKAGVEAQQTQKAVALLDSAGTTSEEAQNAASWARENWSEERVAQYNVAIEGASEAVQVQMIQMLTEQFRTNGNTPPPPDQLHSNNRPAPTTKGYESMEQLIADQSNPKYDQRNFNYDPAYYKAVREKAARSNL